MSEANQGEGSEELEALAESNSDHTSHRVSRVALKPKRGEPARARPRPPAASPPGRDRDPQRRARQGETATPSGEPARARPRPPAASPPGRDRDPQRRARQGETATPSGEPARARPRPPAASPPGRDRDPQRRARQGETATPSGKNRRAVPPPARRPKATLDTYTVPEDSQDR